jgi:flavin reductase (DIM6/NTAB) family NADH-FMN oxidoreductase RutF
MPVESAEFRRILGHWSTGVAVVGARTPDGRLCGLTANAFCSLSLDPPLVLVCVEHTADTHDCIRAADAFAISVLAAHDERTARHFADGARDKFAGVAWHSAPTTGSPVLDHALAWVDCALHAAYAGGDHTIFVGAVMAGDASDGEPLLYYRGGYGRPGG